MQYIGQSTIDLALIESSSSAFLEVRSMSTSSKTHDVVIVAWDADEEVYIWLLMGKNSGIDFNKTYVGTDR